MKFSRRLQSCAVVLGTAYAALARVSPVQDPAASSCKCFPGDACWPSAADRAGLDATVGGRLVETVPLAATRATPRPPASPCRAGGAGRKSSKLFPVWREGRGRRGLGACMDAHAARNPPRRSWTPIFANRSCDPFRPRTRACERGNYVRYAVAARGAEDVQAALAFAPRRNLRFVVRNTGWRPTTCWPGEVVTADGARRTASRAANADLYWALAGGGGGGTYGVVVSRTAKAHPDAAVGGASLSFWKAAAGGDGDDGAAQETSYAGVQAFHEALPAMVDAGTMVVYSFNAT